jgi:hypothetical protein
MASGSEETPEYWTIHHFSLANPQGQGQEDIPMLLGALARHIQELGSVQVHDITFTLDSNEYGYSPSFTVYFQFEDKHSS